MVNSKMLARILDSAEKHVFINIDGKIARISHIRFVNDGESFVLCAGDTSEDDWKTPENIKTYFSDWFNIISEEEAEQIFRDGDYVFILKPDGTDERSDMYESFEKIKAENPKAMFASPKISFNQRS